MVLIFETNVFKNLARSVLLNSDRRTDVICVPEMGIFFIS